MTTVMPEGEALRRAIKWISGELQSDAGAPLAKLVAEAALRFDLSPQETEFLSEFYGTGKKNRS